MRGFSFKPPVQPTDTPPPKRPLKRSSQFHNIKKRRVLGKHCGTVQKRNNLKCLLLNCNGLSPISLHDITDVISRKNPDIVVVIETKHRAEVSYDNISIPNFKLFEARRSDVSGDRPGGGIGVYCKTSDGLITSHHDPDIVNIDHIRVKNERLWVLCETQGCKTAFCAVYLGCQYPDDRYREENEDILQLLMLEQANLRRKGYRICFVGDFNGHVGSVPGIGIKGNIGIPNKNGQRLLNFQKNSELTMCNNLCRNIHGTCANHECDLVCTGKWTWQRGNLWSIIDYFFVSKEHSSSVVSMVVDDTGDWGGDSDHNFCFLELSDSRTILKVTPYVSAPKPKWDIKDGQDWSEYSKYLVSNIGRLVKSSVNAFATSLSSLIHEAMTATVGIKIINHKQSSKTLPLEIISEIRRRRVLVKEWKVLLVQYGRDKISIPEIEPPNILVEADRRVQQQRQVVSNLLRDLNSKERKVNIGKCIGTGRKAIKKFWTYVNGKEKKSTKINSVLDVNTGVLKTNPSDIADEVTKFLKDLFKAEFDPIEPVHLNEYVPTSDHSYSNHINVHPHKLVSVDGSKSVLGDPAGFLDADFTNSEVYSAVSALKCEKAMGWDFLPNECFIYSPLRFQSEVTELLNLVKNSSILPSGWNKGRVVLVHKKGPSELMSNYRPLTVNISITSLYSRVLNGRLGKVVESHDLLGEIQSGFRPNRSCSDNSFILNTIMWKAKSQGRKVHRAFIDVMKAYDTVDRPILWSKLLKLGFGKKFVSCIQNLYHDDCISTEVSGIKTRPLYQSRGVRQGCSLSPLLFALYISDLGDELLRSPHGFNIGGVLISSLFFADDLVLLAHSAKGLIDLISIVNRHCGQLKLRISVSKSKVISPSDGPFSIIDELGDEVLSLEKVTVYKYLGIDVYNSVFKSGSEKQKKAITMANSYKFGCLNVSKRGPDSTLLASILWTSVALPSILFGADSTIFSDTTIVAIDRVQSQVAKSMLSLSPSSSNFVAQTELGIPSFGQVLYINQLNSCLRWLQLPRSRWAGLAMQEHISGEWYSPYWAYICKVKEKLGIPFLLSKENIQSHVSKFYIDKLNTSLAESSLPSFKPVTSLSRASYVCEDPLAYLLAGIKVNYCPDYQCQGVDRSRTCPSCPNNVKSSEFHVLFECPSVRLARRQSGIQGFINECNLHNISLTDSFYLYVQCKTVKSIDIPIKESMLRAQYMKTVRDKWYNMHIMQN